MRELEATAAQLAAMTPGERAWFWLCGTPDHDGPRLLVTRLKDDPGVDALRAAVRRVAPSSGPMVAGLAHLDESGTLTMAAEGVQESMLGTLAGWVMTHREAHPPLEGFNGLLDGITKDKLT